MKKILITGGNGLLGQSLRSFLSKENFEVIASGLRDDRLINHNHVYIPLDVSNKTDCVNILNTFNPDIIINTAAITNVDYCEVNKDECLKVNADSVSHFLPFCKFFTSGKEIISFLYFKIAILYFLSDRS